MAAMPLGASATTMAVVVMTTLQLVRRHWRRAGPRPLALVEAPGSGYALVAEQKTRAERLGLRIVCLSDTHGHHRNISVPDGDVLIHAGDFTQYGKEEQARDFGQWLQELSHKEKLVALGNHENNAPWNKSVAEMLPGATLLRQSRFEIKAPDHPGPGARFFGTDFFWPCKGKNPYFDEIPEGTDVLVAHGPAQGCADGGKGCSALLEAIQRIQPRLVVSGHIHFARGVTKLCHDSGRSTILINAANCGSGKFERSLVHAPIVVDI